jgi:hypothetical protein
MGTETIWNDVLLACVLLHRLTEPEAVPSLHIEIVWHSTILVAQACNGVNEAEYFRTILAWCVDREAIRKKSEKQNHFGAIQTDLRKSEYRWWCSTVTSLFDCYSAT